MFSRQRNLDARSLYDRAFFEHFLRKLREAGLTDIEVLLPRDPAQPSTRPPTVLTPETFVEQGWTTPGIVLRATSPNRASGEVLKVLFITQASKLLFSDDTFPIADAPPRLYFQSVDPARTFAIAEYFADQLSKAPGPGINTLYGLLGVPSMLLVFAEMAVAFSSKHAGWLESQYGVSVWWDIVLSAAALVLMYQALARPRGLWVTEPTTRISRITKRMFSGQIKDNPLVQLIVTVVGGLIVMWLAKKLGILS